MILFFRCILELAFFSFLFVVQLRSILLEVIKIRPEPKVIRYVNAYRNKTKSVESSLYIMVNDVIWPYFTRRLFLAIAFTKNNNFPGAFFNSRFLCGDSWALPSCRPFCSFLILCYPSCFFAQQVSLTALAKPARQFGHAEKI